MIIVLKSCIPHNSTCVLLPRNPTQKDGYPLVESVVSLILSQDIITPSIKTQRHNLIPLIVSRNPTGVTLQEAVVRHTSALTHSARLIPPFRNEASADTCPVALRFVRVIHDAGFDAVRRRSSGKCD